MTDAEISKLVPGQHYRVVIVIPGVWNVPRESVMQYLSTEGSVLRFSLRPIAGTQELDRKHITAIEPTEHAVYAPRKVRKP